MDSDQPVKVTHSEIEITLDEAENKWVCEIDGRERKFESLSKARVAINAESTEKRKRVALSAWYWPEYSGPVKVTITSIADGNGLRGTAVWIRKPSGKREKVSLRYCYPCNDSTNLSAARYATLSEQMAKLSATRSDIHRVLQSLTSEDIFKSRLENIP